VVVLVSASRVFQVACLAGIFGTTGWAAAAPEQEPIRLEYGADTGCPSGREFERMVFKRTHSARPASSEEPARVFSVTLRQSRGRIQGSLTVTDGNQSLVRQVNGRNCAELASVLALATALAIDPTAELSPETASGEQESLPDDTSPASPGSRGEAPPPTSAELDVTLYPSDPPDELPRTPTQFALAVAIGPQLEWAATPNAAVGPSVAAELRTEDLSWTLGITASALFTPSQTIDDAQADFRLLDAAVQLCGLALHWQRYVHGGPCVNIQVGAIRAASSNIPFPEEVYEFWSTVGVHLRLLIELTEHWQLHADVGPNLVLTKYRFEFNEPNTKVFQQGPWTGSGQLMLGYRF
jgi:hypothetical protein